MRMCAIAESKDDAYETATGRDGRSGSGNCDPGPDGGRPSGWGGPENTNCVPVKMGPYYHQRCEVTYFDENGQPYVRVYWIDQNGQWYLPAD